MERSLIKLFLTVVLIILPLAMNAQPGPPPPVGLPIDGGIAFLLGSGIIYAVSKLRRK